MDSVTPLPSTGKGRDAAAPALHIDASAGIAGDMLLAALIDLGAPEETIVEALRAALPPFSWELREHDCRGIRCRRLDVETLESDPPRRTPGTIRKIIDRAGFPETVRRRAHETFGILAAAEAEVHGCDIETIHFHEVGAVDSLVDTLGVLLAVEHLAPDTISCTSLPLGSGVVETEHGVYPVPAPATLKLLAGVPSHPFPVAREVSTPTGVALARVLTDRWGPPPDGVIARIGIGSGHREAAPNEPPNLLRAWTCAVTVTDDESDVETVVVLESNLDHVSGEDAGHLVETLLAAGALEAFLTPTVHKKSRPGLQITVLAGIDQWADLERRLIVESGTLGVRRRTTLRRALRREWLEVEVDGAPIRVKCGFLGDRKVSVRPEFEDLKTLSEQTGVPVTALRRKVLEALGDETDAETDRGNE